MNLLNTIKGFFNYSPKEVIKHFLGEELNDINKEILEQQEYMRVLEAKRNRVELMVFGS